MFLAISGRKIRRMVLCMLAAVVLAIGIWRGFLVIYPYKYIGLVMEYSQRYNLPPSLVCAVIHTESRFRPDARSYKGASGLMQLTNPTADWAADENGVSGYSYDKIFDAELNIQLGCWYLQRLIKQYKGHTDVALAAYNAGSGNVSGWLKDPDFSNDGMTLKDIPFGETKRYVQRVNGSERVYRVLLRIFEGV